jgi:hypothetical protein
LIGPSGVGKSSLIAAHLLPQFERPELATNLVALRAFDEPLAALRRQLLKVWERVPRGADKLPTRSLLESVAEYLAHKGKRLIIIFDQFEEFFILHSNPAEVILLGELLRSLIAQPLAAVTVLLSYREDHQQDLAPLGLPALHLGTNTRRLRPFTYAEAQSFLLDSGLTISDDRMRSLLDEAASHEETRRHIRPIVANLLGRVLAGMVADPGVGKRSRHLLLDYVRNSVRESGLDERATGLLRSLISAAGTAQPAFQRDLVAASNLGSDQVEQALIYFQDAGLVRCLSRGETTTAANRLWQVSHDFIARLLAIVLEGFHRTFWRTVRPWIAPLSLMLWTVFAIAGWPWYAKQSAIRTLSNYGFSWKEQDRKVVASSAAKELRSVDAISSSLRLLQPIHIDLSWCTELRNVDGFQGLIALQSLDLSFCQHLRNVDGLKGLSALQSLNLSMCLRLESIAGLKSLSALKSLDLSHCFDRLILEGLRSLNTLQSLDLSNFDTLQTLDILRDLTALKSVELRNCKDLQNLYGLKGLIGLQSINLSRCPKLQNVDGLKGLSGLQSITLYGCKALQNLDGLVELKGMKSIDLEKSTLIPMPVQQALRSALTNTSIRWPDSSRSGPSHRF